MTPTEIKYRRADRVLSVTFDDGHDSGLYSWATLAEFGRDHARLWQDYLDRVARAGASRDL